MLEVESGRVGAIQTASEKTTFAATGIDNRRDARFTVDGYAEVIVTDGASLFRGRILNISVSGCYIQTSAWIKLLPDTPVKIRFTVKELFVSVPAESKFFKRGVGIGFRFLAMSNTSSVMLNLLMKAVEGNGHGGKDAAKIVEDIAYRRGR